jgi:flavin-binding protein dodecin
MERVRPGIAAKSNHGGATMPDSIYKIIEIVGTSEKSWDDAAKIAVERAATTLEDLRIAEVTAQDLKIEDGKVVAYRTKVSLSFKFRGE